VTPQRLADARMTPPLPPLEPEAAGPQLAAAAPAALPEKKHNRHDRKKHGKDRTSVAATAVAANTASMPIPVHVETVPRTASTAPMRTASAPSTPAAITPAVPAQVAPERAPARQPKVPEPRVAATASKPVPSTVVPTEAPGAKVGEEDQILANIMAGITVPPSEQASREVSARAAPVPAPVPAPAKPATSTTAKTRQLEAANVAAIKQAAADKAAAEAAAAAKRKADEARKAAAAKKAADAKAAAEKRAKEKEEKANPSRIWVQVAGGAYEGDLPKAWAKVKAKAPDAFKGKTGWTTPLRATNRVLAGPFKSDDAAQDFVNQLAKKGIHAFAFTSDKGQKIDKLPTK
jgi:hypothetical protein